MHRKCPAKGGANGNIGCISKTIGSVLTPLFDDLGPHIAQVWEGDSLESLFGIDDVMSTPIFQYAHLWPTLGVREWGGALTSQYPETGLQVPGRRQPPQTLGDWGAKASLHVHQ